MKNFLYVDPRRVLTADHLEGRYRDEMEFGESFYQFVGRKVSGYLEIGQATPPTPDMSISILDGRPLPPRIKDAYLAALKINKDSTDA